MAQGGDRAGAIAALRPLADANSDNAYVHQVLAGFLGCDKAAWGNAWAHYRIALNLGPLLTLRYKAAAFYLAKRTEPSMIEHVFEDTRSVERAAIRTRGFGFNWMFLAFTIWVAAAFALRGTSGGLGSAIVLMTVATALAGWFAFTNYIVGSLPGAS
jgi:hypothetical protein